MKKMLIIPLIAFCMNSCSQTNTGIIDRGTQLFNEKKYKEAIVFYDSLIKADSTNSGAYSSRAGVEYWLNNYTSAALDCNKAIELDKNNAAAYYNRGLVYLNTEKYQLAIEDFNVAIRLKSDYAEAYSFRGVTYGNQEKYDIALNDLNKSVQINSNIGMTYYNRGVIYGYLNKPDLELADYNKALKLDNSIAEAYYNRGLIKGKDKEDYEGAIEDFTSAINIHPKDIKILLNRGYANLLIGGYDSAINDYKKVLEIDKDNEKAKNKLKEIDEFLRTRK